MLVVVEGDEKEQWGVIEEEGEIEMQEGGVVRIEEEEVEKSLLIWVSLYASFSPHPHIYIIISLDNINGNSSIVETGEVLEKYLRKEKELYYLYLI
jgi:hypothetical protein